MSEMFDSIWLLLPMQMSHRITYNAAFPMQSALCEVVNESEFAPMVYLLGFWTRIFCSSFKSNLYIIIILRFFSVFFSKQKNKTLKKNSWKKEISAKSWNKQKLNSHKMQFVKQQNWCLTQETIKYFQKKARIWTLIQFVDTKYWKVHWVKQRALLKALSMLESRESTDSLWFCWENF